MSMTPYNSDITQSLKWLHNNAPNVQSLINQKSNWYNQFQTTFWSNWEENIFNIATANPFGIMIWCIILGVPASIFGLYPAGATSWAYGQNRQNYIYSGTPGLLNPNVTGGNFFGASNTTILNINEARWALMLRYVALVSNGKVSFINTMLRWILNGGRPWDFPGKVYFYVMDVTGVAAQTAVPTPPVTTAMTMEYRIGANLPFSAQFINAIRDQKNGIMPSCSGVSYTVIQEP